MYLVVKRIQRRLLPSFDLVSKNEVIDGTATSIPELVELHGAKYFAKVVLADATIVEKPTPNGWMKIAEEYERFVAHGIDEYVAGKRRVTVQFDNPREIIVALHEVVSGSSAEKTKKISAVPIIVEAEEHGKILIPLPTLWLLLKRRFTDTVDIIEDPEHGFALLSIDDAIIDRELMRTIVKKRIASWRRFFIDYDVALAASPGGEEELI